MVGYGEETKGYNIFYASTHKTFIQRSVQFEEDIIPDLELAPGERSSPQHHDDVSNYSSSDFSDNYDNDMAEDEISVHESPSRPKQADKTIQASGDLAGNPLDHRKA